MTTLGHTRSDLRSGITPLHILALHGILWVIFYSLGNWQVRILSLR